MPLPQPAADAPPRDRFDRVFFRDAWALAKPYFTRSRERWIAWGLVLLVLGTTLAMVYINLRITNWYNDFYNALQKYDQGAYWRLLGEFGILAFIYIVLYVYQNYLSQYLDLRWRRWLTGTFLDRYLSAKLYYHLEVFKRGQDNPDQRIADDLALFSQYTTSLFTGLLSSVANLVAFLGLLWVLSSKVVIPWKGAEHHVTGFLVWVALAYSVIWTWFAAKIGNPLIRLNYHQQRLQADFRYSLVRLRENSEAVAFYRGEAKERNQFDKRFDHVFGNYWRLILRQKRFNWFTAYFNQFAIILPFMAAASAYFAKAVPLGFLMQISAAFGNVQNAFAYLAQSYNGLAQWHAVVDRLRGFLQLMNEIETLQRGTHEITRQPGPEFKVQGLTLRLPNGDTVVKGLDLAAGAGERLLITGRSGVGKSTLLRAIAGLWPFGEGTVTLPPEDKYLFLPQKPYLPLGSLRDALLYPAADPRVSDAELCKVLERVGLASFSELLGEVQPWSHILSLGEQQRLALARVLLQRPAYIFLDEATSAVDEPAERALYQVLAEDLPDSAVISVGHRRTLFGFHTRRLQLLEGGHWEITSLYSVDDSSGEATYAV
ncbi:MAG: ABC transporter ATP-binding protein/permease [Gammaproteobacteria bacterium]|nr:ABC transporter ATP-binding protein/permease [Gammaproteobacteria bacterium]